ncbi:Casparian strip membrane protein domain - like 10 [Theobroma cacao]|uniref:CASP-like protein n=2 Tax=Theobroma cacao TaxID=3641 RepID=A0AB32V8A0_THECC|nr:PREDICTED: CASP-like protein 1D1 [Theobroma cacao]EOY06415.1 CASP-like protein RCOM_0679870, putative [Theobroma cacao]WRX21680.1 Casparian strip membrane protein domain - like 10 [Theobroma cacao]
MASTDKPASPPKPEAPLPASKCPFNYSVVDVTLRVLLFAATVTSVVVMVSSKQTEVVPLPTMPTVRLPLPAKFSHSPALIYFVAALSVTGLYSIITTLASISVALTPAYSKSFLLVFAFLDVVFVGIVASATGAAGGVAYIGLKGNNHVGWNKICNAYDKFCRHVGSSVAVSLFAAILLVLLSMMSTFTLYKKIRD